jgi:hypothetical protein
MEHRSLGLLPGFTPHRCQRRMPGAGTSVEHSLGANRRTFSTLHFGYLTHNSATSRRTEEHIQAPQTDRVHVEQVTGHDPFSRGQELLPARA